MSNGASFMLLLQVITILLVAVAMSLALAHALELPGKMRLDEQTYRTVQTIYYPGFTFGRLGEGLGMLATLVLLPSDAHQPASVLVDLDRVDCARRHAGHFIGYSLIQ
jgi:hypothetical protein